jgi:hypothetical protein
MKNKSIIILLFAAFSIFSQHYHQNLTEDDKNWILSNIGSEESGSTAIGGVIEHHIVEAEDSLIKYIWNHNYDRTIQVKIVEALQVINSLQARYYALALMDTLEAKSFGRDIFPTFSEDKVYLTSILFKLGDFSTAEYVFELLDKYKPAIISFEALQLLPDIIENVPQYSQQAKDELIYAITYAKDSRDRLYALNRFYEIYGDETKQYLIQMFVADSSADNRGTALLYHLYRYKDLNELYKDRLYLEDDRAVRLEIIKEILWQYPTPSNYNFVRAYLNNTETNDKVVSVGDLYLSVLKLPQPDSSKSIETLLMELNELIDTVYNYTWLADQQFKVELQNVLQSAKANLLAGDSLACREDVKSFQDSVDYVYADSLNQDPRFVTIEGWKFLYWNAQYILDRLPEIPSTEGISTYSIFATHGVWLEQNSEVLSGNIGVNEIGLPPFMDSDVEMSIGISTETPAGYTIKANRIKVKQGATVNADVYYNELENNGTIAGSLSSPLELPLFTTLPEFHTSTPGTENIVVPQNGEYTLTPGAYGDIQVKKNGKLIFTGGEYHINNFTGGDNNLLIFQSESEVRIKDKFDSGEGSYIGPQDTTSLSANEIIFYVEGINGNNGNLGATPKAAKIGISNTVKANFYVPNGTLWLRQNSEVEGSFIGKDVDVGIGVTVKLNSAF